MKKEIKTMKEFSIAFLYLMFYKYSTQDIAENEKIDFYNKNEYLRENYIKEFSIDDLPKIKDCLIAIDNKLEIAILPREIDFIIESIKEDMENMN